MRETDPLELVNRYLAAIGRRDFQTARSYLKDRGFRYVSPIAQFDNAEAFVKSMEGVGAILHQIDTRGRFVDGLDVCHVLDVTVAMAGYQTQTVVQLAQVSDGKIARLEVIFDASEFNQMIGE